MITNKINDKKYIGSSRNISQRKRSHLHKLRHGKHENAHLQNAFNKYGEEDFEFSIIEECLKEHLAKTEKGNIEKWETLSRDKGYNISPDINNKEVSQETKDKLSVLAKNRSPEHRKKLSESRKGWDPSASTRKKMSESHKRYKMPQEQKDKISEALKNRKKTAEVKKKMSLAAKGKTKSQEHKDKIKESLTGYRHTEESKENNRKAKLEMSQKTKDKIGKASRGRKHSKESKLKMSKARLEYYQNLRTKNEDN